MDFVDWCDFVLATCFDVTKTSSQARTIGVNEFELAEALSAKLGIADFRRQGEYYKSTYYVGIFNAIQTLKAIGFIQDDERSKSFWKVSKLGRTHIADRTAQWFIICQEEIDAEHAQLLSVINRLSTQEASDHAWVEEVDQKAIASELEDWPDEQIWNVANELWETTSVDFKRELHLDIAGAKAEFVKDVLSLANTKASGQHWMIIGFDDKTHTYHGPPEQRINQNRLEQVLAVYTMPVVDIRYDVIDYRGGLVGMLEVLRDPKKLPYSVGKSIGDRKRIEQDDIFVRHGSQVEKPTPLELQALQNEGDQARLNA